MVELIEGTKSLFSFAIGHQRLIGKQWHWPC